MNPSQCCCAAEISVYGGEDPKLLRGDHLVLSKEEQMIDSWLEENGITMANPVDNIYQYFKQKKQNLVASTALKKPSSLLSRRKNQLKIFNEKGEPSNSLEQAKRNLSRGAHKIISCCQEHQNPTHFKSQDSSENENELSTIDITSRSHSEGLDACVNQSN